MPIGAAAKDLAVEVSHALPILVQIKMTHAAFPRCPQNGLQIGGETFRGQAFLRFGHLQRRPALEVEQGDVVGLAQNLRRHCCRARTSLNALLQQIRIIVDGAVDGDIFAHSGEN